jgi:hypothetical protein
LSSEIKLFLNYFGLDISNCVSQSYDGASVMPGQFNGVQKKIKDMSGNLCPYVHCHAHRLNLVLVDVSRKVEDLHEVIGILEAIYAFQSSSTIRHQIFFIKTGEKIPMHSNTRWVSKFKSIRYFGTVLLALKELSKSVKSKEAAEAKGLLVQLKSFKIIVLIFCLDYVLSIVNTLSLSLQSASLDYSCCEKLIKSTAEQLNNLRTKEMFTDIYNEAITLAISTGLFQTADQHLIRNQKCSSLLNDYITYSTVGNSKRENQNLDYKEREQELKVIFFNILDCMNNEMIFRFTENNKILRNIHACDPKSNEFLNTDF